MKTLIKVFFYSLAIFISIVAKSQFLKYGDVMTTHSGDMYPSSDPTKQYVLQQVRVSNTFNAPLGMTWLPSSNPNQPTDFIFHYPNWRKDSLGYIFGLTIDDVGNVFTSRTNIFGIGETFGSKTIPSLRIWKINATDGKHEIFADIPSSGTSSCNGCTGGLSSLGNLKFYKGLIYVSSQHDGKIYCYNAGQTNQTTPLFSFDPRFGDNSVNGENNIGQNGSEAISNQNLWGLAIRETVSGAKLFYARLDPVEIWSIPLLTNGDFDKGMNNVNEIKEVANTILSKYPISDMSFSSNGNKLLIGERYGINKNGVHKTRVFELEFNTFGSQGNQWNFLNEFQVGGYHSSGVSIENRNSAGGVTYSNVIIKSDNILGCDSTIWYTADAIFYPTSTSYTTQDPQDANYKSYGIQGIKSKYPANSYVSNSVIIDLDNDINVADKYLLGDVEAFNKKINCNSCQCKSWLKDSALVYSDVNTSNTRPTRIGYASTQQGSLFNLSFSKNNVPNKIISSNYSCADNCKDSTVAHVINSQGNVVRQVNMPMQLSVMNEFACGTYTIRVIPYCGDGKQKISCDTTYFKITITCEPPSCCPIKPSITVKESSNQPKFSAGVGTNASSLFGLYLDVNTVNPLSEIRVTVEDFQLSGETGCISCKNYPATWGNLWSGNFNGEQMNATKGAVFGSNDMSLDNREVIYRPGSLINAQNGKLALAITLPPASDISCCIIKASICLKITFKDSNCKECIKMIYLPEIEIRQPKSDKNSDLGPGSNQKQKIAPNKIIITEFNM